MGAALRFKSVPRQQGERARLKVMRGSDQGATYVVTGGKATIGRGEDNDIVLSDLKSSRNHAEISFTPQGWTVRDLGSANGILHNGKATRTANLSAKDTISIGETVLEFLTAEQGTMMLVAPPREAEQALAEQSAYEAQKLKVRSLGKVGSGGRPTQAQAKNPKKMIIYGVVAAAIAFLMLAPDDQPAKKKALKKTGLENPVGSELEKYLPNGDLDKNILKASDVFFKNGFREYRQHNWLRAKQQFETVLQMAPDHALARLYLVNSDAKIDGEVLKQLETAKKNHDTGKLRESKGNYEAVMRLLYRDQTNKFYIQASEQLGKLIKEMTSEVGH